MKDIDQVIGQSDTWRGLTVEYVQQRLRYDAETGLLHWLPYDKASKSWNDECAEKQACTISEDGYRIVVIDFDVFVAHRIAWALMTGAWPVNLVDHKDRNRGNNKWSNLRAATASQNAANRTIRSDNTSGYKGVTFKKQTGRWLARAFIGGKQIHLGYFDTAEEAAAVSMAKSIELHGEFATDGQPFWHSDTTRSISKIQP